MTYPYGQMQVMNTPSIWDCGQMQRTKAVMSCHVRQVRAIWREKTSKSDIDTFPKGDKSTHSRCNLELVSLLTDNHSHKTRQLT